MLNDLFSLMVHLRPTPVVARVTTCMPRLRLPMAQCLDREIAVTELLSEQGALVAGPSWELHPGSHEHDGFWVSFWTYLEPDQGRILTTSGCSAMLLDLHEALRSYPGELPLLGADDIPRGLQLLGQTDEVLSEEDAELLRTDAWHYPGGGG